jgi:hypothetical protein
MKRISVFALMIALFAAGGPPAFAKRENKSIGENGHEAKKAAKQRRKYVNKNSKAQRKAAKKAQKAQRRAAKNSKHHGR